MTQYAISGPVVGGSATIDTNATDIQALGTQAAGATGKAADAAHVHPTTGLVTTSSTAGGDLSGAFSSLTVAKIQGTTIAAPPGGTSQFLRGDGNWAAPPGGVTLDTTATDIQALGTQAAGASGLGADAKHVHPTTGLVTTSTSATGDISGTFPSLTVAKIQGTTISSPPGGTTQFLRGDGSWAIPSGSGVTIDTTATDIQALGTQAAGATGKAADASHVHPTTGVVTTSTSAGGDVSGTFSALTVAKVNGVAVSGTAASGKLLTASSSTAATWSSPATKTYRRGVTFTVAGAVAATTLPGFFAGLATGQTSSVVAVRYQLTAGTCTVAIQRNGVAITGLSALSVTTTAATTTPTAQSLSTNDLITCVITSPSSASNLTVTVFIEDTV